MHRMTIELVDGRAAAPRRPRSASPGRGRVAMACALVWIGCVALGAGAAWAHEDDGDSDHSSIASTLAIAVSRPDVRGIALALLVAAPMCCLTRRRATALSLALIALPLAFETGLHSIHHLSEPGQAADCAVATAAAHHSGTTVDDASPDLAPIESPRLVVIAPRARIVSLRPLSHEGRGPPLPSA
jgi:hypothetical protein